MAVATVVTAASAQTEAPCKLGEVPVPGLAVKALSPAQFTALHREVAPRGEGERWAEIPWQTDLTQARRKAARENKPLLMWIMDGHPLGCT
jgi:hypothetical protein